MHQKTTPQTIVAIVGEDPIIGRALELLLRTAGYGTRWVAYPVTDNSHDMCANAHVVLLMPELSKTSREWFPISEVSAAATTNISILELVSEPDEAQSIGARQVRWPCRLEQLQREIDDTLAQ